MKQPKWKPKNIGCLCTDTGDKSIWIGIKEKNIYYCAGCGEIQEEPKREKMSKTKKVSRAEQAGRRLAESINEMAQLMYNNQTKKKFFKGVEAAIGSVGICSTCFKKYHCNGYNRGFTGCPQYGDQKLVI